MRQQLASGAADVEHARARLDEVRDHRQVATQLWQVPSARRGAHETLHLSGHHAVRPRRSAQPSRNPRSVAKNSGSSSRKASWPLSVSTSTKLTLAAAALSACTIIRFSDVG